MPSKAAGTTLKHFVQSCMGHPPQQLQVKNVVAEDRDRMAFLTNSLIPQRVVASHVKLDEPMIHLMQHMPSSMSKIADGSLVVFVYRHETDRLISAIRFVVETRHCKNFENGRDPLVVVSAPTTKSSEDGSPQECVVDEANLVKRVIVPRRSELGWGNHEVLTCDLYKAVKDNLPNLVFLHYTQVDRLQGLLSRHHCPDLDAKHLNKKKARMTTWVRLAEAMNSNATMVTLDEWLEAKQHVLEWTLNTRKKASCQGRTRELGKALLTCPDEAMRLLV